jgi:hypothetical protein
LANDELALNLGLVMETPASSSRPFGPTNGEVVLGVRTTMICTRVLNRGGLGVKISAQP